jgi:hypothetical protein
MRTIKVLNPVGILQFKPTPHAKRLKDLNNKKIGLYWNKKARGNIALDRVRELVSERYAGVSFEWFERSHMLEPPKEWFENIKEKGVDALVASTGD